MAPKISPGGGRGETLVSRSSGSQRLPRCSPAQAPPQNTHTHTHTHTNTTLPSHNKTHAPGKAVNEANTLNECTGKQVPKREAPTSRLGDYLSLLETRVVYRVLGVICSCLRSPPPLLVERSQKKQKKNSCSIVRIFFVISYPNIGLKALGNLIWSVICWFGFVVLGMCCFSGGSKRTCCVWWGWRCRTRACGAA